MQKMELRITPITLNTNEQDMYVEGLVNATEQLSHVLGTRKKFREKISKGAFTRAINRAIRIDLLAEHDSEKLLATTENGSLTLFEDEQGLKMKANIINTSYGKDLYTLMKEGMVGHMSFGFKALSERWESRSDGILERTVDELELFEVSIVRNPAYPQSSISARGIEIVEDVEIDERKVIKMDKNVEVEAPIEVKVEDLRGLLADVKALVDEVRKLVEKKDETEITEVVEEIEEPKVEEVQEVIDEPRVEEVVEEKVEEVVEPTEERKVDLTSYKNRLNKFEIRKGE